MGQQAAGSRTDGGRDYGFTRDGELTPSKAPEAPDPGAFSLPLSWGIAEFSIFEGRQFCVELRVSGRIVVTLYCSLCDAWVGGCGVYFGSQCVRLDSIDAALGVAARFGLKVISPAKATGAA